MSTVALASMLQQSSLAVHQPGSQVPTRTHFGGIAAWLRTSPPHALPLLMQSVSFVQVVAVDTVRSALRATLATLPPPVKLLMRPILSTPSSANQMFLSGPAVIPATSELGVGMGYSEIPPVGVHRPIPLNDPGSVNHRLPSGPAAIAKGRAPDGMPKSGIMAMGVTRAMLWASCSTNHTLPSGPGGLALGQLPDVGIADSV